MHRAQILLEAKQHQALAEIARQQERSLSELMRQIVGEWLSSQEEDAAWRRRMEATEKLKAIRERVEARYGVIQEDLVTSARDELDQRFDQHLEGEE